MVPQKASGRVGGGGGMGEMVSYTTGLYRSGNFFFPFFFVQPRVKLDVKSIENGLEGQKCLAMCLFWGGCHHPNL